LQVVTLRNAIVKVHDKKKTISKYFSSILLDVHGLLNFIEDAFIQFFLDGENWQYDKI